jgi:hypothetical protein
MDKLWVRNKHVASGFEQRVWASLTDTGELRGVNVPAEFRELLK